MEKKEKATSQKSQFAPFSRPREFEWGRGIEGEKEHFMNTTVSEAQQWSVSQVSDWLNAQGLGSYATAFADKGIDGIIYNQSAHHSCVTQLS